MKLGKLSPKFNEKTLLLREYVLPDAPEPPSKVYWEYKVDPSEIGMYGNDVCGDCTCAAYAHAVLMFTAHVGKPFFPDPAEVLKMYSAISGYDPSKTDKRGDNPTDTGCAMTDVLNYAQTVGLQGHKILGWAQINPHSLLRRHQGIYIFGCNNVGVQLPASAEKQFSKKANWEVLKNDGGILGGHCILESGYGSEGSNFETWGKGDQKASDDWGTRYLDEAYVMITKDWINEASGLAPNQLNLDQLRKDLVAVSHQ